MKLLDNWLKILMSTKRKYRSCAQKKRLLNLSLPWNVKIQEKHLLMSFIELLKKFLDTIAIKVLKHKGFSNNCLISKLKRRPWRKKLSEWQRESKNWNSKLVKMMKILIEGIVKNEIFDNLLLKIICFRLTKCKLYLPFWQWNKINSNFYFFII